MSDPDREALIQAYGLLWRSTGDAFAIKARHILKDRLAPWERTQGVAWVTAHFGGMTSRDMLSGTEER